jgi:Tfp pilus assembly protein PilP
MPKDFPSFSTLKNAVPQIRRKNWAILEKLQDSANFTETFYSTQKNKTFFPNNLTI